MNANELYLAVVATYTPYQLVNYFSLSEEKQQLIGPLLSQLGISFDENVTQVVERLKSESSRSVWQKIMLNEQHLREISRVNEQELRAFINMFDKDDEQVQFVGYILVDNLLDLLAKRAIELNATTGHVRWFDYLIINQKNEQAISMETFGNRQEHAYF